ncbi:AbrB/MazE/SpoVT family DNA-binding domain-containing protein [Halobaculum sp. D14]|uniref:AbrB/MazE/SpoVT family DNA-binding domain-containing protein n=1 Tax=Halobaculum sp. D14 TaxID=3421642 RepID=UPI003EC0DF28
MSQPGRQPPDSTTDHGHAADTEPSLLEADKTLIATGNSVAVTLSPNEREINGGLVAGDEVVVETYDDRWEVRPKED